MKNYRFVISPRRVDDPRSAAYLTDAHTLGLTGVSSLRCHDLYFVEGELSEADLQRLAVELLSDPVTQDFAYSCLAEPQPRSRGQSPLSPSPFPLIVEVALRPGVTDPVAEQIVRGARELGIAGVNRASTGLRFEIGVEVINKKDHHREHREHGVQDKVEQRVNRKNSQL